MIACLTEELEQLGYEVTRLEAAAVEVSAARDRDSPWILELLGFRSTGDRIAVFVGPDELRVSALAADDSGTRIQGFGTMTESQRQVERVVTACAELRSEASSGSGANGEKSPSDVQAP